uniref:Uncharacterized protein n=1 Tax=Branchiostoma floridae TaxID=7739 RepID=C3ZHK4_BRAFL|eukprot:XP_002591988.1 hypothetical protein BRAFLDRAFT_79577 [Branchiostoma floridae]
MLFDTESPYNPQGTSTPKWSPPQTTASVVAPPSGTVSPPKTFSSKNGLSMGIMQEVTLANTTTTSLPSYTLPLYETEFRAPKGPPTTMYIPPGGKEESYGQILNEPGGELGPQDPGDPGELGAESSWLMAVLWRVGEPRDDPGESTPLSSATTSQDNIFPQILC